MGSPSKTKVKNFRRKVESILREEIKLRKDIKRLYDQFVLDVDDEEVALSHVRQAYFHVQKKRIRELMSERLKFHPFFSANSEEEEMPEEDDGII